MVLLFGCLTAIAVHNNAHGWAYICLVILVLNAKSSP